MELQAFLNRLISLAREERDDQNSRWLSHRERETERVRERETYRLKESKYDADETH